MHFVVFKLIDFVEHGLVPLQLTWFAASIPVEHAVDPLGVFADSMEILGRLSNSHFLTRTVLVCLDA